MRAEPDAVGEGDMRDGIPMACVMAGGDVNLDGTVDGRDLADFMDAWAAGDEARADLNRDGTIGWMDADTLLEQMGTH